jgi:hypothetical protein
MSCDPPPRSIDDGLDWFLSHEANGSGMCAQHTWHSLGGDRGCPPAWGCTNANQVYDKVKKSGRYWTTPRRGDIALWKYGSNGHAARVYDEAGTLIATTNPTGESGGGTGIEPIGYPAKWGGTTSARIFTDTYNGIKCFDSEESSVVDVYNYEYSGKSEDVKEIPLGTYTWVTKDTDDPAASGLEFKLIYLNVKLRWARKGVANIRLKFVREGDDPTAYQDFRVIPLEEDDSEYPYEDDFLITHDHFEQGEKGIGGKWYIKISSPALKSAAVDTRYNKYATIKDKG